MKEEPLTMDEIIKNAEREPEFTNDLIDFKSVQNSDCILYGQINKQTLKLDGIGRKEYTNKVSATYGQI